MKNDYETQALAVNTVALGHQNSELGEALHDAEITLNAVAVLGKESITRNQKLESICQEIIAIVDEKGCLYDEESLDIANRLKKILKEK